MKLQGHIAGDLAFVMGLKYFYNYQTYKGTKEYLTPTTLMIKIGSKIRRCEHVGKHDHHTV